MSTPMQLYKCPVCGGSGLVNRDFYWNVESPSANREKCLTCEGTGVIFFNGVHIFSFPKGNSSDLGDKDD